MDDDDRAVGVVQQRLTDRSEQHAGVAAAAYSAAEPLGFRPELVLDGPLDSAVPDELRADLLAVVREALSNVVRHARASHVKVAITVGGGRLSATVTDNGAGGATPRGGLVNRAERANLHGGQLSVEAGDPVGTVLRWSVPTA